MTLLLGCIADDFTGGTDLANTLVAQGMRTVQLIGVPGADFQLPEADAIVVALKSRTIPAAEAVGQSCAALEWLRAAGARQFFFKYCSTFDSTDQGNIGPVADALLERLGEDFSIACPAFPTNARTLYRGYLFVGDGLLSESGMRHHPLTPMTDANLVRVLGRQTAGRVGLVPYEAVEQGADAIRQRFAALRRDGFRYAIVDALSDRHLLAIGAACKDLRLITGGSGVALGLPANFRAQGLLGEGGHVTNLPAGAGLAAVLSGSCSVATLGQIEEMQARGYPAYAIDPLRLAGGADVVGEALAWARPRLHATTVLIYASAPPEQVARIQEKLGRAQGGELIEQALAAIARGLVDAGVRRLVVAGGETSGAVVNALNIPGLRIGAQIDPGVPWTQSLGEPPIHLALKSGNFGGRDFFEKAFRVLP
ncbi:MAG: four-carbon acid sugar kinase family protein [Pseudomonadota bacterium]|nr:four-carbon acid sugar kinase family protein [Pseudomonadota bacterium]